MVLTARMELKDLVQFLSNSLSALSSPVQVRAQPLLARRARILHGARSSPNGILEHHVNACIMIELELA